MYQYHTWIGSGKHDILKNKNSIFCDIEPTLIEVGFLFSRKLVNNFRRIKWTALSSDSNNLTNNQSEKSQKS